jgi:hypothetical protein
MTDLACGGACGKPGCTFVGTSKMSLGGHVGGSRSKPPGSRRRAPPPTTQIATTVETPETVTVAPSSAPSEPAPAYPDLRTWEARRPALGEATAPPAPEAAAMPTAAFDSTGLWRGVGELIDRTLLKDKAVKVRVDEAKAAVLDKSLQQVGIVVEAPVQPIVVNAWVPLLVTVFSVFVLPLLLAYAPDLLAKIPFLGGAKKEEADEGEGE